MSFIGVGDEKSTSLDSHGSCGAVVRVGDGHRGIAGSDDDTRLSSALAQPSA